MVASITNLGRSGLYDWVIQRLTAVILAVYTLFLLGFVIAHLWGKQVTKVFIEFGWVRSNVD